VLGISGVRSPQLLDPQVKLRNGSADRPRYEASQLSLTTCNIEGLVVVGLCLRTVVLCTISILNSGRQCELNNEFKGNK